MTSKLENNLITYLSTLSYPATPDPSIFLPLLSHPPSAALLRTLITRTTSLAEADHIHLNLELDATLSKLVTADGADFSPTLSPEEEERASLIVERGKLADELAHLTDLLETEKQGIARASSTLHSHLPTQLRHEKLFQDQRIRLAVLQGRKAHSQTLQALLSEFGERLERGASSPSSAPLEEHLEDLIQSLEEAKSPQHRSDTEQSLDSAVGLEQVIRSLTQHAIEHTNQLVHLTDQVDLVRDTSALGLDAPEVPEEAVTRDTVASLLSTRHEDHIATHVEAAADLRKAQAIDQECAQVSAQIQESLLDSGRNTAEDVARIQEMMQAEREAGAQASAVDMARTLVETCEARVAVQQQARKALHQVHSSILAFEADSAQLSSDIHSLVKENTHLAASLEKRLDQLVQFAGSTLLPITQAVQDLGDKRQDLLASEIAVFDRAQISKLNRAAEGSKAIQELDLYRVAEGGGVVRQVLRGLEYPDWGGSLGVIAWAVRQRDQGAEGRKVGDEWGEKVLEAGERANRRVQVADAQDKELKGWLPSLVASLEDLEMALDGMDEVRRMVEDVKKRPGLEGK